jgi:hypothetical protein
MAGGEIVLTMTVSPELGLVPLFCTVWVNVPVGPAPKFGSGVTETEKGVGGTRVAESEELSLPGLISPPPVTVAVFTIVAGALAAMLTVSVMGG